MLENLTSMTKKSSIMITPEFDERIFLFAYLTHFPKLAGLLGPSGPNSFCADQSGKRQNGTPFKLQSKIKSEAKDFRLSKLFSTEENQHDSPSFLITGP